ncbi:MAG: 2-C-methyl-D-erythritol 4-phosphate cytidylyltransferase [Puniceicoccaceae bacterium]|nr:MAG: 2-C-methyl-D-erythritol 4-phosphate cytidylyltransferase [Puniceicoccaceae bacterium]
MPAAVILLAAGQGSRMEGHVADKALTPLNGVPAIKHSIAAFIAAGLGDPLIIVYRDDAQRNALQSIAASSVPKPESIVWVPGGSERQESVQHALKATPPDCEFVYIHDVARPCIRREAIMALQTAVERDGAATLAHPIIDTIKRIPAGAPLRAVALEDLDRSRLWAMETPQAFRTAAIRAAHQHVRDNQLKVTDDTAALACIGQKSTLVPNPHPNPKLTTPSDLAYIEQLLKFS